MIKHGIFLIGLLLLICSCHPDEIIETTSGTDVPDAVEVETTKLTGTIKNEFNQGIQEATVDIYQHGELVKTVQSDNSGEFLIDEIAFSTQSYRLFVQKDGYLDKMDIFITDELESINHEILLASEGSEIGSNQVIPSDTSLIYVSGTLINNNGPLPGILMFISDLNFIFYDYSITQTDGSFGFFADKNEPLHLLYFAQCDFNQFTEPISIGSFTEDTDIGNILVDISNSEIIEIQGIVNDCSGSLFNGDIYIYGSQEMSDFSTPITVTDGVFDAQAYICNSSDTLLLEISSYDNPWLYEYVYLPSDQLTNLEIDVCETPFESEDILFFVDNYELSLADVTYTVDSQNTLTVLATNSANQSPFKISLDNIDEGENQLVDCLSFTTDSISISMTDTDITAVVQGDDDYTFVQIQGEVIDTNTGLTHNIFSFFEFER